MNFLAGKERKRKENVIGAQPHPRHEQATHHHKENKVSL